tara:strand:+ start:662 stop:1921 length:1260 start_codon:yes stop_codon:yes gene_type:complete
MVNTPKQTEVINDRSRYKVLNWGRRSGKTTTFAKEAFITTMALDNAKVTYYAQTFGDARDIAWQIFLDILGDTVVKKNESLLEITVKNIKGGTSKINLKGWESVVTSEKGRGTENDLLLADEVAFCRGFKFYWDTVLEPTLLTTRGRVVFGSTPNGFNDFYDLANTAQNNEDWFYSHATSYDNPYNEAKFLDKKKLELPEDRFVQEYLADFRKQEGLVYKEFTRNIHTFGKDIESTIDKELFIGGVDFGYTNPAAIIDIIKDKRGVYWVVDEYYEKEKTDAQLAEVVGAKEFIKVYPDPENAAGIKELRNRRINTKEVVKGKDSVKNGINKIRELFKQGRLKIHKRCLNLIWEIETYHYPPNKEDRNQDELPVKENDHLLDALRYVVTMDADTRELKDYNAYLNTITWGTEQKITNPAR